MLLYLDVAYDDRKQKGLSRNLQDPKDAIHHGAVQRLCPKIMTASVIMAGLLPIMWSHRTGADVMKRIAPPMIGGAVPSVFMELLIYPWSISCGKDGNSQRLHVRMSPYVNFSK